MSAPRPPLAVRFSENAIRARKRAGLSQEQVGYRASLHRTEISILERGLRMPQLDTIVKLAGGLSVSPADLLEDIEWVPGDFSHGEFRVRPNGVEQP